MTKLRTLKAEILLEEKETGVLCAKGPDGLPCSSETTSISVPTWLMEFVDATCREDGINRSAFVQKAIRAYLLTKMDTLSHWLELYNSRKD